MEFLAGISIIITLCLILGFSVDAIITAVLYVMAGLMCLSEGFFIVFLLRLLLTKRTEAEFSRIAKEGRAKYDSAYYLTDEGEFKNIFPCEVIMRDKFYKKDRKIKIRTDRFGKKRRAFDKNATATIILGTVLCAPIPIVLMIFAFGMR